MPRNFGKPPDFLENHLGSMAEVMEPFLFCRMSFWDIVGFGNKGFIEALFMENRPWIIRKFRKLFRK